jgi:uncharacterized membrane protein YkgB
LVSDCDWLIATMKVTGYEAKGIEPMIAQSIAELGYSIWTVHHFTEIIGATKIVIAILIALRRWFPKESAVVGADFMFLTTLSFIITTPGWERSLGGFPALSGGCRRIPDKGFDPTWRRVCGRWLILWALSHQCPNLGAIMRTRCCRLPCRAR